MKMTNEFIGNMINIMSSLNETGKLGYAIAYNMRKMQTEAKEYLDLHSELLAKYGEQKGNSYFLDPKKDPAGAKKYMDDMGDIPQIEHEIDIFNISPEDFYSGDLTSQQMANLMWMVDNSKA